MQKRLKIIFSDLLIRYLLGGIIFLIFGQAGILYLNLSQLPSEAPLFYSLPWGNKQLAPVFFLFLFPIISFIFLVINFIFSLLVLNTNESETFLTRILFTASLLISLLSFIGLWNIILILI